jgi:hypothetical protein
MEFYIPPRIISLKPAGPSKYKKSLMALLRRAANAGRTNNLSDVEIAKFSPTSGHA